MIRNVGNLDISRGPAGTVELRVRHISHLLDATALRMPPTVAVLSDSEVGRLIEHLNAALKEKPPTVRPARPAPDDDYEDIA